MAGIKEWNEGGIALAKTANSLKQALADGTFNFPTDLTFFFDDINAWQEGVKGFSASELATAGNGDIIDSSDQVFNELSAFGEEDRYDMTNIYLGITSGVRLASRKAYQKGQEDGKKELVRQLKEGEVALQDL